jgi:hypothetical protein
MTRLRGRFDGQGIVLDQSPPPDLKPDTPVEVLIPDDRDVALAEFIDFGKNLWATVDLSEAAPTQRSWTREELYERGRRPS